MCPSKQKVILDTSIKSVKFGTDITLIGGTAKLAGTAGKLIIEDPLKVVTKADKTNIKPHHVTDHHNLDDQLIHQKSQDILTKNKIQEYFQKGRYVSNDDLISDFKKIGLTVKGTSPDNRFIEFADKYGNVRAKIHPADKVTRYDHIHLYDRKGNPLSIELDKTHRKDPLSHIPFKKAKAGE